MNYYILDRRSQSEKDISLKGETYDMNKEIVKKIFFVGESLVGKIKPPFTVILDERRTVYNKTLLDKIAIDTNDVGAALLLSPKAQEVFDGLKLPIEFVEVLIKGHKIEIDGYKYVNVVSKISCTDREKSSIKYLNETVIWRYYSLVLDVKRIPKGTDIFLLGEDVTMMVIVSEKVKKAVEDAKLTGFNFIKPEEYKTFR
jgi:hypothetical protein